MIKYTTGEIARLCGVSVRTVQYYDERGILVPSEFSEGGRRLYSDTELNKMKIICFLRNLDMPIETIRALLKSENSENVIKVFFEEREKVLRGEIAERQNRLEKLEDAKKALCRMPLVSKDTISDIAYIVENKKRQRRLHKIMLTLGFIADAIQVSTLMVGIFKGVWLPFAVGMGASALIAFLISVLYYKRTVFICPECHDVFKTGIRESFFVKHTPYTRKLKCKRCGYHGFCVETYGEENEKNAQN